MSSSLKTPPASRNSWSRSSAASASRERPGHLGDVAAVLLEEVEVGRLAGVELLLDAVDPRHQHRREGEVRVRGRVRAAELDALGRRRVRVHRDPDRRRAVPLRVDEVDRRLVAGHEPAVRVRRRGAEGEQGRGVHEDPAEVAAGELGEARVAGFVGEERRALLPERLVRVHPRAVVAEDRLRHEGRRSCRRPWRRCGRRTCRS